MSELFRDEIEMYMADYGLPEMPEYYEGPGARALPDPVQAGRRERDP